MHEQLIAQIVAAFEVRGNLEYGERVSVLAHSLQAAAAAERDGCTPAMIAAALLHDYGHLIHDLPEDCAAQGIDSRHEELGAAWLAAAFGPEVSEPVRLHVDAKRYLCAYDPAYLAALSAASRESLQLQGGPFTIEEAAAFAASPYAAAALQLRRYDDLAKQPEAATPDLAHFRPYLVAALRQP